MARACHLCRSTVSTAVSGTITRKREHLGDPLQPPAPSRIIGRVLPWPSGSVSGLPSGLTIVGRSMSCSPGLRDAWPRARGGRSGNCGRRSHGALHPRKCASTPREKWTRRCGTRWQSWTGRLPDPRPGQHAWAFAIARDQDCPRAMACQSTSTAVHHAKYRPYAWQRGCRHLPADARRQGRSVAHVIPSEQHGLKRARFTDRPPTCPDLQRHCGGGRFRRASGTCRLRRLYCDRWLWAVRRASLPSRAVSEGCADLASHPVDARTFRLPGATDGASMTPW